MCESTSIDKMKMTGDSDPTVDVVKNTWNQIVNVHGIDEQNE